MSITKRFLLFLLISFLTVIAISLTVSAVTYETYLDEDDILADGWVDGSYTLYNTSTTLYHEHGYIQWDISSIPANANITEVGYYFYVTQSSYTYAADAHSGRSLANNSLLQDGVALWNDWAHGSLQTHFNGKPSIGQREWNTTTDDFTTMGYSDDDLCDAIESNVTRGWFGFILSRSNGGSTYIATSDHDTYQAPCLWIRYELTGPVIAETNTTPLPSSIDQCLNVTNVAYIYHDLGLPMNITWYGWNGTGWNAFGYNNSVNNGTYRHNNSNWTDPCTTYYWYIKAEDFGGNVTESVTFEFKTHCITPPTDLVGTALNLTAVNLTFTPDTDACGTSYTIGYYQHGSDPPAYGSGTYLGNNSSTNAYFILNDLTPGQVYCVALWTYWNSSLGTWHLSVTYSSIIISAEGGNYRIAFYDEETRAPLNFSRYPNLNATHLLKIHYYDATEDTFRIHESDSDGVPVWTNLSSGQTVLNVSATYDVWYFELICNYDFDENLTTSTQIEFPQYTRKLSKDSAVNISIGGHQNETIRFYLANYTVYGSTYYEVNTSGSRVQYTDSEYENSLVKYEYQFTDQVGTFLNANPNTVYVTIYEKNITGNPVIIHQEFLDSSGVINPALIFEKDYLLGINKTDCTSCNITNFGLAPTSSTENQIIVIRTQYTDDVIFGSITTNYSFSSDRTSIYFTYTDPDTNTRNVTIIVYRNDSTESSIYTSSITSNNVTFNVNPTVSNMTYYINLYVNKTVSIEGVNHTVLKIFSYYAFINVTNIGDVSLIEIILVTVLGNPPTPGVTWSSLIILFLAFVIFLVLIVTSGASIAFLGSGFTLLALNAFLSNVATLIYVAGSLLAFFGILILVSGWDRKRRSY